MTVSDEPNKCATEWGFQLREGIKFHFEEPFNAQAMKYSIDLFKEDSTQLKRTHKEKEVRLIAIIISNVACQLIVSFHS